MHGVKSLFAVILLSAMALAQSSSSTPATPSSGSQDPNQPQSPLQEPPKPTEAEQNRQQQTSKFDTGNTGTSGEDQQLGEIRLTSRWTEVGGDQTRSFRVSQNEINKQCVTGFTPLTAGTPIPGCIVARENNIAEFNYFLDRRFLHTNHRIQFLGMYRGTDDPSVDSEHNSLQKAYMRIFGPRDELIIGDALVNYSRLSFNQNIKGVSYSTKVGEKWKVSGATGVFIDRYGSLFKELQGRPYMSFVLGGRVERKIVNQDSMFGVNFSTSRDQVSSLSQTDPFTLAALTAGTSPQPAVNSLFSIDNRFQTKNGFRIESELAFSFTDFDRRNSPGGCAAPCDTRFPQPTLNAFQNDWGARIEASYRYKKLSFRSSYVRYQPNFASINARQISDLQDWVFRTSYDATSWLTMDGTVRRSNDDLKGQKAFKTTLWGPEMKFIFHDMAFYRRAVIEMGYRHRDVSASNGSAQRFIRSPYVEFTVPVKQTYFNIGYERRQAVDAIDGRQSSNTDRIYAGLRGIYDIGNWEVNPSFRYELERQTGRPSVCDFPLPVFPATVNPPNQKCNLIVDPTLVHDSNRLGSASLFIQAPRYFIFEASFRASTSTLTTLNPVVSPITGLQLPPPFQPTPNGFSRPAYKGALTYKIRNDENMTFTFGFERNSNFYFTSPNYDERIWSGTLMYRFGRKAQ